MARLLSVNVGLPKEIEWRGERVLTAVWKQAADGPRMVRRLNVDGDGQGDLAGHGGEHRAVFVYQLGAYAFWEKELGRADFTPGQFGENFTVEGLPDDEVRVGDRFRIGQALFEVTQPRVTCYRIGIRMDDPDMPARLVRAGKPGFYFRVLEEGVVRASDAIELVHRDADGVSIADVDAVLYRGVSNRDAARRALASAALSDGWRTSLRAILDQPEGGGGARGLAPGDLSTNAKPGFRAVRIVALERVASDIVSLALESADARPLEPALPGQFVVLRVGEGSTTGALMRSYSLCGPPGVERYELGIKCERGGAMGGYVAERARVGEVIESSAPRGAFVLRESSEPAVFLSAGIGITPVLAMLKMLAAAGSSRPIWWLFGARNRAEHPFADDVRALLAVLPGATSHVCYSRPAESDRPGLDFDSAGRIDAALIERLGIPARSDVYLCGPQAFVADMRRALAALGFSPERIRSELFGAGPALRPGIVGTTAPLHLPPGPAGNGPSVSFARSGIRLAWDPTYSSLLELAEACSVPVRWSCRIGVCHTCETGVVSGNVTYAPEPLQAAMPGNALLCCSVPASEIVLDL